MIKGTHRYTFKQVFIGFTLLLSGFLAGYSIGDAVNSPDCQEDEVYAVQYDPDPSHGLTWACQNVD